MKVLVPVKRVIDPYVKIQVKQDGSGVHTQNVKMAMNPFDEIAMEEAVRWKEQSKVEEIVAISIGQPTAQETLRQALALGADKALLIETEQPLEPLAVAKILKKVVEQEQADLVIMGKQAIDDDFNQTGQMLAALLDWPQATFASKVIWQDQKTVHVTREVDGGLETLEVDVPCVITTDLRLNEPRYLGLPNIMKAKKKPLEVKPLSEYEIDTENRMVCQQVTPPPSRQAGVQVKDVAELMDLLRNKEKVI